MHTATILDGRAQFIGRVSSNTIRRDSLQPRLSHQRIFKEPLIVEIHSHEIADSQFKEGDQQTGSSGRDRTYHVQTVEYGCGYADKGVSESRSGAYPEFVQKNDVKVSNNVFIRK